jgi:hypothetical protein
MSCRRPPPHPASSRCLRMTTTLRLHAAHQHLHTFPMLGADGLIYDHQGSGSNSSWHHTALRPAPPLRSSRCPPQHPVSLRCLHATSRGANHCSLHHRIAVRFRTRVLSGAMTIRALGQASKCKGQAALPTVREKSSCRQHHGVCHSCGVRAALLLPLTRLQRGERSAHPQGPSRPGCPRTGT